jgi:hypothetical protein
MATAIFFGFIVCIVSSIASFIVVKLDEKYGPVEVILQIL